jgi:PAS domain S-box-containing protein
MFRPIPKAVLFRTIPHWLIAFCVVLVAMSSVALALFSLEPDKLLLVVLISAISAGSLITFLHYDNTKRTLEEVKSLARNILQSIPTGVLTINCNGVVTAVNPTAEAVLKRRAADVLGNSYVSVFGGGDIIREVLDGALKNNRHMNLKDMPYEGIDGRLQTIRVSTVALRGDDGRPAGVLLQAQDVTEWLELEQRVRVAEKLTAYVIRRSRTRVAQSTERHGFKPPSSPRRTTRPRPA